VAALRARGGAVVFATQNLEEVELIASRVAALREGRLVFEGSSGEYDRAHVESLSA
jgi:ABC-type multidrug transport system ATPase subunit